MTKLIAKCPICDGEVTLSDDVEESEIVNCPECENRVVVGSVKKGKVVLEEAPEIEEDWGE